MNPFDLLLVNAQENTTTVTAPASSNQLITTAALPQSTPLPLINPKTTNPTIFQYFEWNLPNNGKHWIQLTEDTKHLSDLGITSVWLPPASKGVDGKIDVGYSIYDRYDLGEFFQKGSTRTKYGTKQELQSAISELHTNGIKVLADVVMGQLHGSMGEEENTMAAEVDPWHRSKLKTDFYPVQVYTKLTYPVRNGKYSDFKWNVSDFTGIDYNIADTKLNRHALYLFQNKQWNTHVSIEHDNYDLLLGADVDYSKPSVRSETIKWGEWLTDTLNLDGYRMDAVKHIDSTFVKEFLDAMRAHTKKDMFAVSEFAWGEIKGLENYLNQENWNQTLFDFGLKNAFANMARAKGRFDIGYIKQESFAYAHPDFAVTKVNTHDSQPGQIGDEYYVPVNYQPLAYTYTLTRQEGTPVVFYGDYYGIINQGIPGIKNQLDLILKARKEYAYGKQRDYFDHPDVVGWTREGDAQHPNSGLASLISDRKGGTKFMYVGKQHAGELWKDLTGNQLDPVLINQDGFGEFRVNSVSHSIYVMNQLASNENQSTVYLKSENNQNYTLKVLEYKNNTWTQSKKISFQQSEMNGYLKAIISSKNPIKAVILGGNQKPMLRKNMRYDFGSPLAAKVVPIQKDSKKQNQWFEFYRNTYTIEMGYDTIGKPADAGQTTVLYQSYDAVSMVYSLNQKDWITIPMKPSLKNPLYLEAAVPTKQMFEAYFVINNKVTDNDYNYNYVINQSIVKDRGLALFWTIENQHLRMCDLTCSKAFFESPKNPVTVYYKSDLSVTMNYRVDSDSNHWQKISMTKSDQTGYLTATIMTYEKAFVNFTIKDQTTNVLEFPAGIFMVVQGTKSYYNSFEISDGERITTLPPTNLKITKKDRIDHLNIEGYYMLEWDDAPGSDGYHIYLDGKWVDHTDWLYLKWGLDQYTLDQLIGHVTIKSEYHGVLSIDSETLK